MIDTGKARRSDPETSHKAAHRVRPGTARYKLLLAHCAYPQGLTDEEAATAAGLSLMSEYATRCSELRDAGFVIDMVAERRGHAGVGRMVRKVTVAGAQAIYGPDQAELGL